MEKSSKQQRVKPAKPEKPTPDFPLTAHPTGRWCKKINRKTHYFGPWRDAAGALAKYNREREDLEAGRVPCPDAGDDVWTVAKLANRFLNTRRGRVDRGIITERSFGDYYKTCARIVATFGKNRPVDDLKPADFEILVGVLAKTLGPVAIGNEIGRVRVVFGFAVQNGFVDKVTFGTEFVRPDKEIILKEKNKRGSRMFEADELRRIIDKATVPLKAMALLGINCGLGQSDCANVPLSALDLDGGWITYPRPKTGVARRAKLWSETVQALRDALASRPVPASKANADLLFVTSRGNKWVHTRHRQTRIADGAESDSEKWSHVDVLSKEFKKLCDSLGINGGRNFYCLRRGFETIAGDSLDQVAVDHVMGHSRGDMASVYRQRIDDARLVKVADVVHAWLFPPKRKAK
ncbi:MAG TPA: tyrosine-type recombinase/integrase [Planctomycetaceae bacterium]|jgi:integrase